MSIDWQKDTQPITSYDPNWTELADPSQPALGTLFDNFFGWVNDSLESRYITLDQERAKMLEENPDLNIQDLDDGFSLEAKRLNAINQKNSKGFTIVDINPGLLDSTNFPLNLPFEFLFDGTNFMPQINESITQNFRTVSIEVPGNFCKVEYIFENNSTANSGLATGKYRPYAGIKYGSALNTISYNGSTQPDESDLESNYRNYSFDTYARSKVFINFSDVNQKPHLIQRSGDYFKTYFNTITLHLNIGAPKIRITIGTNSEKFDGPSNGEINSKLALTGSAQMMNNLDSVLSPFCLTEYDNGVNSFDPSGKSVTGTGGLVSLASSLVANEGQTLNSSPVSMGYSVLWITRIYFNCTKTGTNAAYIHPYFYLLNTFTLPITPPPATFQKRRVHNFKLNLVDGNSNEYVFEPAEPVRVVIPNGWKLALDLEYAAGAAVQLNYSYAIDGYAYGDLLRKTNDDGTILRVVSSKYVTDATFLADYNRIECLREP